MKHRTMRVGARTATKLQEGDLVRRAGELMKDPGLIIPRCGGKCVINCFLFTRMAVRSVHRRRKDKKALERLCERGNELARAYAGTLLLAHTKKAPFLPVLKTNFGDFPYAKRGSAGKEALAAVQHYNHPVVRLLWHYRRAVSKGIYIFSDGEGMLCTGKRPVPPEGFLKGVAEELEVRRDGDVYSCPHIAAADARKGFGDVPYFRLHWPAAGLLFAMCRRCVGKRGGPLGVLLSRCSAPKPAREFRVRVVARPACMASKGAAKCPSCILPRMEPDAATMKEYFGGKVKDADLMDSEAKRYPGLLSESVKGFHIAGWDCYGSDRDAFVGALRPSEVERKAVTALLGSGIGPVISEGASAGKLLAAHWAKHGRELLKAAVGDDVPEELLRRKAATPEDVARLLRDASESAKRKGEENLPRYGSLPEDVEGAEAAARAFRRGKRDEAMRLLDRAEGMKPKSIAYALLLAMGQAKGRDWRYSKEEREFGEHLRDAAARLLECPPEEYHEALVELVQLAGVSGKVVPEQ